MTFEDHPALRKLVDAQEGLTRLSLMIDGHNIANGKDPEAMLWGRVAKVAEEGGEAVTALIGITNQNPRKGTYSSFSELDKELLDVAVTALGAIEHIHGNPVNGSSIYMLLDFIITVKERLENES